MLATILSSKVTLAYTVVISLLWHLTLLVAAILSFNDKERNGKSLGSPSMTTHSHS